MEKPIFGVINSKTGEFIDTSLTMKGCKRHATINGYNDIGYRIGYHVIQTHTKSCGKWIPILFQINTFKNKQS